MILLGISPLALLAAIVVGYLLGSIPFGVIVTRAAGVGDVRNIGSGNMPFDTMSKLLDAELAKKH